MKILMQIYSSKYSQLSGTDKEEIIRLAWREYHKIQKLTPRRTPYVRSKYFTKDKVFVNTFWEHLNQKIQPERIRRLKFYTCAIDLLRNNTHAPEITPSTTDKNITLYRFYGRARDNQLFCVQVKANLRNNRKEFMSVFPIKSLSK